MTCRSVRALVATLLLLPTASAAAVGDTEPALSFPQARVSPATWAKDRPPARVHPLQRPRRMMAGGPIVQREVMGYLPYWEMSYDFPRWDLLTTLAWFGVELNSSGEVVNWRGWQDHGDLVEEAHAHQVRVVVTILLFGEELIGTLLSDPVKRQTAIETCLTAMAVHNADGVNIDFETVPLVTKNEFTAFMTDLKQAVVQAQPNGHDGHVTLAGPAVDWDGSYDYDQLLIHTDGIMAMAYDYHWVNGDPGPISPLTSGDLWSKWNVSWTIDDYLLWGKPENRHKIFLGLPLYGRRWPVANTNVPGTALAEGAMVRCSDARENAPAEGYQWDQNSQTAYYHEEDTDLWQVWFDDQASFGMKVAAAVEADLGGIGLWALGYDGEDMAEWVEIEDQLAGTIPSPPAPDTIPDAEIAVTDTTDPSWDSEAGPVAETHPDTSAPSAVSQTAISTRTAVTTGCTTGDGSPTPWGAIAAIVLLAATGRRARWSCGRGASA